MLILKQDYMNYFIKAVNKDNPNPRMAKYAISELALDGRTADIEALLRSKGMEFVGGSELATKVAEALATTDDVILRCFGRYLCRGCGKSRMTFGDYFATWFMPRDSSGNCLPE